MSGGRGVDGGMDGDVWGPTGVWMEKFGDGWMDGWTDGHPSCPHPALAVALGGSAVARGRRLREPTWQLLPARVMDSCPRRDRDGKLTSP